MRPLRTQSAARPTLRRVVWVATAAWALGILALGSLHGGGAVPLPGAGWDKLAHGGVYGGFGALFCLALQAEGASPPWSALLALVAGALLGGLDEVHQAFVPGRTSSLADVAADAVGAGLGAAAALAAGPRALGWLDRAGSPPR